jgi:hypothetical protein
VFLNNRLNAVPLKARHVIADILGTTKRAQSKKNVMFMINNPNIWRDAQTTDFLRMKVFISVLSFSPVYSLYFPHHSI